MQHHSSSPPLRQPLAETLQGVTGNQASGVQNTHSTLTSVVAARKMRNNSKVLTNVTLFWMCAVQNEHQIWCSSQNEAIPAFVIPKRSGGIRFCLFSPQLVR